MLEEQEGEAKSRTEPDFLQGTAFLEVLTKRSSPTNFTKAKGFGTFALRIVGAQNTEALDHYSIATKEDQSYSFQTSMASQTELAYQTLEAKTVLEANKLTTAVDSQL